MEFGKVSIIIPVYNVEKYFNQCIDSLLCQTYTNIELLIVNDGSTDRCGEKADAYAEKDSRIRVFHKKNEGLPSARNYGLKYATGMYYCFVDSDDYVKNDYVEKMLITAVETDADMVFCNYYNCYENTNRPSSKLLRYSEGREFAKEEYLERLYTNPGSFAIVWNKLYRREVFKDLEFANMLCEDAHIILSVVDNCKKIFYLPEILYFYRRRKSSTINGKRGVLLQNDMKWIGEHMKTYKITDRMYLFAKAQKLYISRILEKYCYCEKEKRKTIKNSLKEEVKKLLKNPYITKKIKIKYFITSCFPYLYGKYYYIKRHDRNVFWD